MSNLHYNEEFLLELLENEIKKRFEAMPLDELKKELDSSKNYFKRVINDNEEDELGENYHIATITGLEIDALNSLIWYKTSAEYEELEEFKAYKFEKWRKENNINFDDF